MKIKVGANAKIYFIVILLSFNLIKLAKLILKWDRLREDA